MNDTKGYEVHKPVLKKTTAEAEGWRLKEPVPGFTPMSCHTRDAGRSPALVRVAPMQWVFSDGLASVSLFVEPFDAAATLPGIFRGEVGATHSVTRRVGRRTGSPSWAKCPRATLRRFALALERTR